MPCAAPRSPCCPFRSLASALAAGPCPFCFCAALARPAERATAGNRRVRASHHSRAQQNIQPQQQPSPFMFEPLPMNTDELGRMAAPGTWGAPIFPAPPANTQFDNGLGAMSGGSALAPGVGVGVSGDLAAQNMGVAGMAAPPQLNMFDALLAGMPNGMGADVALDSMGAGINGMGMDMWSNMPTGYG